MASNYDKHYNGVSLIPQNTTTPSAKGDVRYNSTSDKIEMYNGAVDPLVGEATTATLTNKTLSGNTATNLVNSSGTFNINSTGTITVPNATDTLVGKATTDTLTNKTLSGNTATNLVNSTGTFNFNSSGTLTAPNATDTLVGKATTDTLTNKTLSGNTSTNFVNGSGTLNINSTGTITVPNATDTLVGRTTTDTGANRLQNKDLSTNNVAFVDSTDTTKKIKFDSSNQAASTTATFAPTITTNRTYTFPDVTDTIVARTSADTLTNKTIGDAATYTQVATPSNPAAGFDKLYFKSDDKLYSLNSGGTETLISSGAASSSQVEIYNLGLASSVATNAFTVNLKQSDGSTDPTSGSSVKIGFRSSTVANGNYNERSVTAALSLTIPSGTTIGTQSNQQAWLWLYALDNAGTVELAISLTRFDEQSVQTTSAISGGSSNSTLYSTTARSNVPVRLIGRIKITETTAGTWASNATELAVSNLIPYAIATTTQEFSSGSGTYTTPTNPLPLFLKVTAVGGGGGGGGCSATAGGQSAAGSGGGGGGTCISIITSPASTYTYVVGAGGTGVSGANGNAGSASTFSFNTMSAGGGGGGANSAASAGPVFGAGAGGGGGSGSGGTYLSSNGGNGCTGVILSSTQFASGGGGGTFFIPNNQLNNNGAGNGASGSTLGQGGYGAGNGASSAAKTGGTGATGVVIVEEHYQ